MPRVRNIMTRALVTFDLETTIRDAMETLCTAHLSGAPVLSGHRVAGVISMTDLLSFLVTTREVEQEKTVEGFSDTWEEPEQKAEDENIQEVMDDELLDDWAMESDNLLDQADPVLHAFLDQHVVEEVMTTDIVSISSDADVRTAAALMEKHGIHRILVIDGAKLTGIVSALDIARAFSRQSARSRS